MRQVYGLKSIGLGLLGVGVVTGLGPIALGSETLTYTTMEDWLSGVSVRVNSNEPPEGHVKLNESIVTPFSHIWVAASGRGTVVRIDTDVDPTTIGDGNTFLTATEAGGTAVMGEYFTSPDGMGRNPSRTTVDANGDVWVGNRNESGGGMGSAVKVSATASGATTSSGVFGAATGANGTFDARTWTNTGSVDTDGGTDTASDPAILQFIRTAGTFNRHLSVNSDNNVWIGGAPGIQSGNQAFQLYDGNTGEAVPSTTGNTTSFDVNRGGYGGLVDGNGVVWSAGLVENSLVRFDPATGIAQGIDNGRQSYGMAADSNGKVWVSNWDYDSIQRFNPDGTLDETFVPAGMNNPRGVAITGDDHVWTANSFANSVSRLDNDGNLLATVPVGSEPTGVAVDSNGKVWVTNRGSNSVMRIDPSTDSVDLTVDLGPGSSPYNYSDMTGTVLFGTTIASGTWRDVFDSGLGGTTWEQILWNTEAQGVIPDGTELLIEARVSEDMLVWSDYEPYLSGDLIDLTGRFIELRATFSRNTGLTRDTAILSDLSVDFTLVPEPGTAMSLLLAGLAFGRGRRGYYGWQAD